MIRTHFMLSPMSQASIPVFEIGLDALTAILDTAAAFRGV